ncbi:hypothetical protein E2562_006143 [Oryza meyeriana var. granulata]|uniref:Wall-associated receptor kinase galacturonan-binding domain-containing protein n=1 Tax=Oryza meyeriana var. granulata TaxID=110450 RepID=A0A6G1EVS5_9ORYZ|nr:hypothetical protein E2562_006143 [Oryza meyeriana var. granulata]
MHLAGGLLLLYVHLLLILPNGALSATASGRGCQHRCSGLDVPYPFGFSDSCPILLSCNEGNSMAALLRPNPEIMTWHLTSPALFSASLHQISLSRRAPTTYASEDADCSASVLPADQPRLTRCSQIHFRPSWGRP